MLLTSNILDSWWLLIDGLLSTIIFLIFFYGLYNYALSTIVNHHISTIIRRCGTKIKPQTKEENTTPTPLHNLNWVAGTWGSSLCFHESANPLEAIQHWNFGMWGVLGNVQGLISWSICVPDDTVYNASIDDQPAQAVVNQWLWQLNWWRTDE